MKKFLLVALAVSTIMVVQSSAAVIDTFNVGSTVSSRNTPGTSNTPQPGLATTDVIGGSRYLSLIYLLPPADGLSAEVRIDDPNSTNSLTVSNASNVDSQVRVLWDASGAGLNATINNGGLDFAFVLSILNADLNVNIGFNVIDMVGGSSSLTINNIGVGPVLAQYANFVGTADFTSNIRSIELVIDGPTAYDVEIDFVGTSSVPEPSTYAMFGSALLGLGLLRRRKA